MRKIFFPWAVKFSSLFLIEDNVICSLVNFLNYFNMGEFYLSAYWPCIKQCLVIGEAGFVFLPIVNILSNTNDFLKL